MKVFVKDPAPFVKNLGLELPCPVRSGRLADLTAAHTVLLNHESYVFSDAEAKRLFNNWPHRYCGKVTDPVTMERFQPRSNSPSTWYADHRFFFASETNRIAFLAEPEPYANPKRSMRPKDMATDSGS